MSNAIIRVQANAVPNRNPNKHSLFDDCHHHTRIEELERRIQRLEANIHEHVFDGSLRERLLATQPDFGNFTDELRSPVVSSSVRSKRQDSETQPPTPSPSPIVNHNCVPYPDYVNSNQCTICGGNLDGLSCKGKCQQEIITLCDNYWFWCPEDAVCIDCSDVSASTRQLEQVPCPPAGHSGPRTSEIVLLLDYNHHLDLTFGYPNPYAHGIGAISLSNTTLNGSQFNFGSMNIYGNFNMSSATIIGSIVAHFDNDFDFVSAFQYANVYGSFDMSSVTIQGDIGHRSFEGVVIDGNFNMSLATINGDITDFAFDSAHIGGNFDMSSATIHGDITNYSYQSASIGGNFDMSSATIYGDITNYAYQSASIGGNFDMRSATIYGDITSHAYQSANIGGKFDMRSATIYGDITSHISNH